jgi:hypothetical protein
MPPYWPLESQVATTVGLWHSDCPGAQRPWHPDPETHVWFLHGCDEPQLPVESHVTTSLDEHCVEFGVHSPVHTLSLQTNGHGSMML